MVRSEKKLNKERALRAKILDAATMVLARNGYKKTTIEGIAEEAGMSKGGVFYYFSSKEEILLGTLDRYSEVFYEQRDKEFAKLPDRPSRLLRATIITMLKGVNETERAIPNFIGMLDIPEFRDRLAKMKRVFFKELTVGVANPGKVAEIFLLLDGLWMDKVFSPNTVYGALSKPVEKDLFKYIDLLDDEFANAGKRKTGAGTVPRRTAPRPRR